MQKNNKLTRAPQTLICGSFLMFGLLLQNSCWVVSAFERDPQTWVAGGGFLSRYVSGALKPTGVSVDTTSLVAVSIDGTSLLESFFKGQGGGGNALFYPATNGGVEMIDTSDPENLKAPTNVATGGYKVSSLAVKGQVVYAAHPDDSAISLLTVGLLGVSDVSTVKVPGRNPELIAVSKTTPYTYVISGSDLVKLQLTTSAVADRGLTAMPHGASSIGVGDGFVVVTNFDNDNIYIFSDNSGTAPAKLLATIQCPNGSPAAVAVSQTSPRAFVSVFTGSEGMAPGYVDTINLSSLKVVGQWNVGACPNPIAIVQTSDTNNFPQIGDGAPSWSDHYILVGNQCDPSLSAIDKQSSNLDVPKISLTGSPEAIFSEAGQNN
jgi:hypothetical protein